MNELFALASRMRGVAEKIEHTDAEFVSAAAETVKASVEREIGRDLPRRRVAGGRVGASWKLLRASGPNPRALVKADGPLHLVNNDTQAHLILPKGSQSGHSRATRLANYSGQVGSGVHPLLLSNVAFDDGPGFAYAVHHPGTKGKRTWQHGVEKARPLITEAIRTRGVEILRGLLR